MRYFKQISRVNSARPTTSVRPGSAAASAAVAKKQANWLKAFRQELRSHCIGAAVSDPPVTFSSGMSLAADAVLSPRHAQGSRAEAEGAAASKMAAEMR